MPPHLHWCNAALPANTTLFAVGDIHANDRLLRTLLSAMRDEINALPADKNVAVIFLGDYIDRGPDAPATIELLMEFERFINARPHSSVRFLCGNHDEFFTRVLTHTDIIDAAIDGHTRPGDLIYTASTESGALNLRGLELWLFIGGGITSLRNYCPQLDETLFDEENKSFKRHHPQFSIATVRKVLADFVKCVPTAHRDFFMRCVKERYAIIGDYLFTHAGLDPMRTLAEQGIGDHAPTLSGKALIDFLMIRNPFLWRESLPHCPYVVVHGHTPSDIEAGGSVIVDAQKDYRLCIDTTAYAPNGAITCFVRDGNAAWFMAANQLHPSFVTSYSVPPLCQKIMRRHHEENFPQYHQPLRRAVFLDRDGVLIRTNVVHGKPYAIRDIAEYQLLPEVGKHLEQLKMAGYVLIVVTNQPDIDNGLVSKEFVEATHARLRLDLPVDAIYFCPHDKHRECDCRKPKPGMFMLAAQQFQLDLQNCWMVGDRASDVAAGKAAGCRAVFIDYGYAEPKPDAPSATVHSLAQAAQYILTKDSS